MSRYEGGPPPGMMFFFVIMIAGSVNLTMLLLTQLVYQPGVVVEVKKVETLPIEADMTCPKCLDIPKGMKRLRQTILLAEQVTISLPRPEYLKYLTRRCQELTSYGQSECLWRIHEISEGEADVNLLINPIYGRGIPLQEKWIDYIKRRSYRVTTELLEEFERGYVGNREKSFNGDLRTG